MQSPLRRDGLDHTHNHHDDCHGERALENAVVCVIGGVHVQTFRTRASEKMQDLSGPFALAM